MTEETISRRTLRTAVAATLPVMAGYLVLGAAFGILLSDKGYSAWWALLMSTTIYAGSMQFVALGFLNNGASLVSAAIMTLLVNARHLVYGISMLEKFKSTGRAKPYLIFALTDETYALLCAPAPEGVDEKRYFLLVSALDQLYWISGSVVGALVGSALTFDTTGIDFAMTALFIVIFTEQWLTTKDKFPAVSGVLITLACLLIFGAQSFLVPSMVIIIAALTLREALSHKRSKNEHTGA